MEYYWFDDSGLEIPFCTIWDPQKLESWEWSELDDSEWEEEEE